MTVTLRPAHPANYEEGRRGTKIDRIVVHLMAGTLQGTAAWFGNPASQVSAHYGVGANGEVHEYVNGVHTAWHAGDASMNRRSIGVEHEGDHPTVGDWRPTPDQWAASIQLAAELCKLHDIEPSLETIVPHSAVSARKPRCPGPGFDLAAYVGAVRLRLSHQEQSHAPVSVRLFDPVTNEPIGEGTLITGTDKVYVKRIWALVLMNESGASEAPTEAVASEEDAMKIRQSIESLWESGWLGKVVLALVAAFVVILLVLVFSGRVFAQSAPPELLNPATWFTSVEAVLAIAGVIAAYLTKLTTALGKDWFKTEGNNTVILSAVVAAVIGGIGGWLALGAFTGTGGLGGAVAAIGSAVIAFLGSNASAKAERQALAGAVSRIEALEDERSKTRLL